MDNVKVIVTDGNKNSVESRLKLISFIFVDSYGCYMTERNFSGLHKGRERPAEGNFENFK